MSEGTVGHRLALPSDDRPKYLREDNDLGYLLAVDTETDGNNWWDGHRPFIATASDYDRDYLYRMHDPQDVRSLAMAILSADALVFHNAPYDVHMLVAANVVSLDDILAIPIYDTYVIAKVTLGEGNMVGSHLGKFGLKNLAAHFVDGDALEPERVMKQRMKDLGLITRADQKNLPDGVYHELWKVEPEVVETYAMKDTRYTYDLFQVLMEKHRAEPDLKKRTGHALALEIEREVAPELIRLEHRGMRVDPAVVDDLHAEYSEKLDQISEAIGFAADDVGMDEINPDATKDVVALLEAHGVVITEVTDGGYIRTDKKTLEAYEDNSVVALILDYRRTSKFLRTYLEPMKDRDVVHTSINPLGAWTHRMSSRRPNMQNIPARDEQSMRIREMFIPRDGYALIAADYDRVEPTLLAWYMNDEDLMRQFQEGDPYSDMRDEFISRTGMTELGRQQFKNAFLAITYGVGINKLAKMIDTVPGTAAEVKDSIEAMLGPAYSNPFYPPLKNPDGSNDWSRGRKYNGLPDGFVQRAKKKIKGKDATGYVTTIGGSSHRILPSEDGNDNAYRAPNTIIQGSAAYIMKRGLTRAARVLRDEYGGHVLMVVHDEIWAEVPLGVEHDALEACMEQMRSAEDLASNGKLRLAVTGKVCYTSIAEAK